MTHTRQYKDEEGTFGQKAPTNTPCRRCKALKVVYQPWASDCGSYLDSKYTCLSCGEVWWIDGPDA